MDGLTEAPFAKLRAVVYPLPLCDHYTNCRICGAPLAEFHSRYAKYCGQDHCPTARGCAEKWQCAPRTWEDKAEKLAKAFEE